MDCDFVPIMDVGLSSQRSIAALHHMAAGASSGAEESGFAGRHLFRRRGLEPGDVQRMKPRGQPGQFGLRQVGERRHGALAAADDGFDAGHVQGAQMRIVDQRGCAVPSPSILAMAAGTGRIEIPHSQSRIGGGYDRGRGFLRGDLKKQGRGRSPRRQDCDNQLFHRRPH
jgi:hypothetical protein